MDNEQKETHGPDEQTSLTRREFHKGGRDRGRRSRSVRPVWSPWFGMGFLGRSSAQNGAVFEDAFTIGPKKGSVLDRNQFDAMLTRYYKDRGWDPETTRPGKLKLKELGLDSI